MISAIDLCGGAGGWACAARGLPVGIRLAVDRWDRACRTYELNHQQTEVRCLDLTADGVADSIVDYCRAESIELVLGAIPCEWLTSYRRALNVVQDAERERERKLLDVVLEIVRQVQPRWWCLEDVTELRKELPILTPHITLDARHWSPQRRKRLFVGRFPRPKRPANGETLASRLRPGPYRVGPRLFDRTPQTRRTFSRKHTLAAHPDRKAPTVLAVSSRRDAEVAVIDDRLPGGMRQFEWQELARLQGFPDDYLFYGSPSDVARMVGQAIQIDVGHAILEALCREAMDH